MILVLATFKHNIPYC